VKRLGLPGLIIRNLFTKWLGGSENNLSRLIDVVSALAPCTVLIDEIDLFGVGSRRENGETDGGTTGRMGQRFLEWLGSEWRGGSVEAGRADSTPGENLLRSEAAELGLPSRWPASSLRERKRFWPPTGLAAPRTCPAFGRWPEGRTCR